MTIEEFGYNASSIRWRYHNKSIKLDIDHISFANIDRESETIMVICGANFSENQIYLFSYEGIQIFACDKRSGEISWENGHNYITITCENIEHARLYLNENDKKKTVMVLSVHEDNENRIEIFNEEGKSLYEIFEPANYTFSYLSSVKNTPSVVCQSNVKADKYQRNICHFTIDVESGKLQPSNGAY